MNTSEERLKKETFFTPGAEMYHKIYLLAILLCHKSDGIVVLNVTFFNSNQ